MTAVDALGVFLRRWYVMVMVLVTATAVGVQLYPGQHTYSARTTVVFIWPGSLPLYPTDDGGVGALVNFAALVRQGLSTEERETVDVVTFGGTLAGAGVTEGSSVVLPNSGGQWSKRYDQPALQLETVNATPEAAVEDLRSLLAHIDVTAASLQERLGVPPQSRVTTSSATATVEVFDGGATGATRARGLLGVGVLGLITAAVATVGADRLLRAAAARSHRARGERVP